MKTGKNKLIIRWIFYLAGLMILALGIMLNTKSNLGVSPIILNYLNPKWTSLRLIL